MKNKNKISLVVLLFSWALTFTSFADAILKVTEFYEGSLTTSTVEWIEIQNTGDAAYSNNLFMLDQNVFEGGDEGDREQVYTGGFNYDETFVIQPGEVIIVLNDVLFDAPTAIDNFQNFWFGHTNSGLQFGFIDAAVYSLDTIAESVYFYDNDTNPNNALFVAGGGFDSSIVGLSTNATYSFAPGSGLLEPSTLSDSIAFPSVGLAGESGPSTYNMIGSPGFVATVPEPSALALLTFSALFLGRRRLRLKFGMTSAPLNKDSIHKYSS